METSRSGGRRVGVERRASTTRDGGQPWELKGEMNKKREWDVQ